MIKRSNKTEETPDFDEMMNEVEHEMETLQAKQAIIDQVPELRQLGSDIEKLITAVINSKLSLETSIQQAKRAESALNDSVRAISKKVDTINDHIDGVIEEAPSRLNVAVHTSDADMERIEALFSKQRQWMMECNRKHFREISEMLADERERVRQRYREYDGCYFGHFAQWFIWPFFTLGLAFLGYLLFTTLNAHYHWL